MDRVGIFEAKSRLSELIERAHAGDEVTITRHGKPVAKLVPAGGGEPIDRSALFREMREFRRSIKMKKRLSSKDVRSAIEWGRR